MLFKHCTILLGIFVIFSNNVLAAPGASLLEFWQPHQESSTYSVDNSKWQLILDQYLVPNHQSKINRFNYSNVTQSDNKLLAEYLTSMQALDPRTFNRNVQKSYWINLYNALTVKIILDNYPTTSITKLGDGFFSFGPWDDKIATIQNQRLSLNDIEHRILRPIWKDNRIHYAVNCASISCPNLSGKAYNATNTESILETAAQSYVNHSRAVTFKNNSLVLSSIYEWYIDDFGGNDKQLLMHLTEYANKLLKQKLINYSENIEYSYDWNLNEP